MAEEKKTIRINIKKPHSNNTNAKTENKEQSNAKTHKNLELLEKTVRKIENKYKNFGFLDSKEEDFFYQNQGKKITLELANHSKIEGILDGIDKFRICISVENIKKYYFKHAILCYYC